MLGSDAPRTIQFRQGGKDAAGRAARREASIRARRMAALRAAGIAVALDDLACSNLVGHVFRQPLDPLRHPCDCMKSKNVP